MGALVIGLASGYICFMAASKLKRKFGYDDSLDVFGVHAVGGIVGALLAGVFSATTLGVFSGSGFAGEVTSIGEQVFNQSVGIGVTIIYCGVLSFIILKVIDAVIGLRVSEEDETEGLDLSSHGERGYIL
jgi:Amt family ammonium transporter